MSVDPKHEAEGISKPKDFLDVFQNICEQKTATVKQKIQVLRTEIEERKGSDHESNQAMYMKIVHKLDGQLRESLQESCDLTKQFRERPEVNETSEPGESFFIRETESSSTGEMSKSLIVLSSRNEIPSVDAEAMFSSEESCCSLDKVGDRLRNTDNEQLKGVDSNRPSRKLNDSPFCEWDYDFAPRFDLSNESFKTNETHICFDGKSAISPCGDSNKVDLDQDNTKYGRECKSGEVASVLSLSGGVGDVCSKRFSSLADREDTSKVHADLTPSHDTHKNITNFGSTGSLYNSSRHPLSHRCASKTLSLESMDGKSSSDGLNKTLSEDVVCKKLYSDATGIKPESVCLDQKLSFDVSDKKHSSNIVDKSLSLGVVDKTLSLGDVGFVLRFSDGHNTSTGNFEHQNDFGDEGSNSIVYNRSSENCSAISFKDKNLETKVSREGNRTRPQQSTYYNEILSRIESGTNSHLKDSTITDALNYDHGYMRKQVDARTGSSDRQLGSEYSYAPKEYCSTATCMDEINWIEREEGSSPENHKESPKEEVRRYENENYFPVYSGEDKTENKFGNSTSGDYKPHIAEMKGNYSGHYIRENTFMGHKDDRNCENFQQTFCMRNEKHVIKQKGQVGLSKFPACKLRSYSVLPPITKKTNTIHIKPGQNNWSSPRNPDRNGEHP